ncbi:DUF1345 domain-containing protein [Brachybacterium sp. AOP43-C2-M15]|uniref:DUF1345 domain-containing protein n=1 Tax=Brachybacterium sp. AOP43-C2-M15 TaxID=3457661 RepID=UPI0040343618
MRTLRTLTLRATSRLAGSLLIGVLAGLLAGLVAEPAHGALIGIATTATVFVVSGAAVLWSMDAEATREESIREAFGPLLDELSIVVAGVGGVAVTIAMLILGGSDAGYGPALVALLSVFMLWAALHLVYVTHYAYLYYGTGHAGGIGFGIDEEPSYREFIYFSFTIGIGSGIPGGMSVSDTGITSVVMRHGLLAYVFRTVIMAAAINVVVGVFTG